MIIESQFKPLWWLTNPHVQTIYSSIKRPVPANPDKLEKIELPDGDFLELAWSTAGLPESAPLVIILHGLGGGLQSSYVPRFMRQFNKRGWRAVLMQFRGAGKEFNRLPRSYHSGDTADLEFVVQELHQREPDTKKAIVGVSLGGNVLLKWLGEQGVNSKIDTAIAISVPFLLRKVANKLNVGFSRIYQKRLLGQLKDYFSRKMDSLDNPPVAFKKAAECHCFWTFDNEVTAPLNGFSSVHSYYRESSSRQFLKGIAKPTLIIHALDDPFMTADVMPTEQELSSTVRLEWSKKGGHMGFVSSSKLGLPVYWADQRVCDYLAEWL